MKKGLAFTIATFFGVGRIPFAPGTFGSLATLPLAFILAYYWGLYGILGGIFLSFVIGIKASKEVLKYTPHDPGFIVIDEVAGQLMSFCFVAPYLEGNTQLWIIYLAGFVLFRFFDIFKPQPVRWADRKILNAFGVMFDDIIAGCYAALILLITYHLI